MITIVHKYSVGDKVKFKDKFIRPSCGLVGREGTVVTITGIAKSYNNKPHYYLNNEEDVVYPENLFVGKVG
jgi:DNA/RNA endonuclease YhcR with UshA esterase domain